MNHPTMPFEAMLGPLCRQLKLPGVARDATRTALEAERQGTANLEWLCGLLQAEVDARQERRATRRIKEAGFPLVKTLEGFDFRKSPDLPEGKLRRLADGDWIERAETVILLGDPGTGKTHLATALGVAAASRGQRVRFVTASALANELTEARDNLELRRVVGRYSRIELLILDELGYVPLSRTDAELLFQVLSDRQEQRALILTTNLPFGEWTSVFPDPRLCKAVLDRLAHRAHIIETGTRSIRLQEAKRGVSTAEEVPTND
ncbi:MAG: DNA replication protein DnaC [Myxococcota bacterium]|jgi:DNA replication protein DnaC